MKEICSDHHISFWSLVWGNSIPFYPKALFIWSMRQIGQGKSTIYMIRKNLDFSWSNMTLIHNLETWSKVSAHFWQKHSVGNVWARLDQFDKTPVTWWNCAFTFPLNVIRPCHQVIVQVKNDNLFINPIEQLHCMFLLLVFMAFKPNAANSICFLFRYFSPFHTLVLISSDVLDTWVQKVVNRATVTGSYLSTNYVTSYM